MCSSEPKAQTLCELQLTGWNILNISPFPGIVLSHTKFLSSLCRFWHFFVSYAPANVKPQDRGAGHTQGDVTFQSIFTSNSLPRGETLMSNTPSLGLR